MGDVGSVVILLGRVVARPKFGKSTEIVNGFEVIVKNAVKLRGNKASRRMQNDGDRSGMFRRVSKITTNASAGVPSGLRLSGLKVIVEDKGRASKRMEMMVGRTDVNARK